ncbi:MAG: hypothetical protein ACO3N7_10905 [Kiritimatiellia bacterium]
MRRIPAFSLAVFLMVAPAFAEDNPSPWWEGVLWYVPNRVMDLMDVFRLRVKVGPGLDLGVRVTDAFSFYGGTSKTIYAGFPGPRHQPVFPPVFGYEQKQGMVLIGLDASDDMPNPPQYEFSEIGVTAHFFMVGVDAGVSFAEMQDFVAGIFGIDLRGDDFPRSVKPPPLSGGGVLRPLPFDSRFPVDPKPEHFGGFYERLDYLEANVPLLLQGYLCELDRSLTDPDLIYHNQPPVNNLRLSLFFEGISGPDGSVNMDPDIKLKIDLPNFENQLSLFVQSSYDDDLPGTDIPQRDDKGWSVGARRQLDKLNISADIGVHTKWPPELFLRTSWRPHWEWGDWKMGFEQRIFWENEDGFGLYSALHGFHWVGKRDRWLFRSQLAGKFSEDTQGYEWQQTFNYGKVIRLKDETRRRKNVGIHDILDGYAFNGYIFGQDEQMAKYRSTFAMRQSIYRDFIVLQIEPGLEWRNENDWTTQYRVDAGISLLF